MYAPGFIVSNASRFLDHEWIDLPVLEAFLEKAAASDLNASARTDLRAADRCLLDTLSVREVTAFRNHVRSFSPLSINHF
jgi:hypothetical protein